MGTSLRNEAEFGPLGIYLGKILEDKIPTVQGLNDVSEEKLKQLGATLATTGMVNTFHHNIQLKIEKVETVSSQTCAQLFHGPKRLE